jgi:hypothetical protein
VKARDRGEKGGAGGAALLIGRRASQPQIVRKRLPRTTLLLKISLQRTASSARRSDLTAAT